MPDWVEAHVLQEGTFFDRREGRERPNFVTINPYFQQHPEMVLGDLQITSSTRAARLTWKLLSRLQSGLGNKFPARFA